MACNNNGSLINVLNAKIDLVKTQTKELQMCLQGFLDKISSDVIAVGTEKLPANRIAGINSSLDSFLALLMGKWPQINDISADMAVENSHLGMARSSVSTVQTELLTDISALMQRVEKLETDVVLVMNHQQVKEADIQAAQTQALRLEEELKIVTIEKLNSEKEHNSRFESLNNRVKVLEEDDRLNSLQKQVNKKLADDSDVKEHEGRISTIEDIIQNLEVNYSEMGKITQNQSDEVNTLKKSLSDIQRRQDKLESVSDNLSDSQNYLSNRVETAMDRLAMSKEERKFEKEEFNKRLSTFELKRQADVMILNNLDSLFKQVCHMVVTKVNPLCRLQGILNQHHAALKTGSNSHSQMKVAMLKVNNLVPRVQKLESDSGKSSTGFTAYFHSQTKVTKGSVLKFTDVRYNGGAHYNPVTGMFTATREGVYVAVVTLSQSSEGSACVQIVQNSSTNTISGKVVCKTETSENCVNSCGIGIASLKAGDVVFVTVKDTQANVCLSGFSSFSCVLIA